MDPEQLQQQSDQTSNHIIEAAAAVLAGEMTMDQFLALVVAIVQRAQQAAVAFVDLGVGALVGAGALGLFPDAEAADRAEDVAVELAAEIGQDDFTETVSVEVRAEVMETAQMANEAAITEHGVGWRRQPNAGACEMCRDLAKPKPIPFGPDTQMIRHKGCGCLQRPDIQEENHDS